MRLSKFVLDVVSVPVAGVSRYHFSEETGKEQHHAENHRDKRQIEQRLVGHGPEIEAAVLVHEFRHYDPDGHHEPDEEHEQAAVAEEVHGAFAEFRQEPQ